MLKHEDSIKNGYDKISGSFGKNKANNRQIFLQVLQSIKQKARAQVSFAVNFAKFLRTPFLQNTFSGCFSFHLRFYFGMLNLDNNKTEQSARPVKIFVDYLLYFSQSYQKFYRNCFYWNLHLSNIIYWLRKAMIHEKLSHLMLLSVHKTKTNELSLTETTSQFCQGNRGRSFTFPRFTDNDLPKLSPV